VRRNATLERVDPDAELLVIVGSWRGTLSHVG
jgi:hypothetical protein